MAHLNMGKIGRCYCVRSLYFAHYLYLWLNTDQKNAI